MFSFSERGYSLSEEDKEISFKKVKVKK